MDYPDVYSFEDALKQAKTNARLGLCTKDIRILLGNGFSRAYYGDFEYTTLFDAIKNEKENERIRQVFDAYGNSNFEGVLKLLQDGAWLVQIYGQSNEEILVDYERIKSALAEAIVKVHPANTGLIPLKNKQSCHNFISQFRDIFTVNYDLLLYWVVLNNTSPAFGDYFTREEDTPAELCEYVGSGAGDDPKIYFLHGALHLFQKDGKTVKRVWTTMPLVSQVKEAMDKGEYPLVVAEGDSSAKDKQMSSNPYLKNAYDKFKNLGGQLFTYGFSFADQDNHLMQAIARNPFYRHLWIGIRGGFEKDSNVRIFEKTNEMKEIREGVIKGKKYSASRKAGDLKVHFYDSGSMDIWSVNK